MDITVTEAFLLVWATSATFAALYFHSVVQLTKRFTTQLFEDPVMYADIRKTIENLKEKHNG